MMLWNGENLIVSSAIMPFQASAGQSASVASMMGRICASSPNFTGSLP